VEVLRDPTRKYTTIQVTADTDLLRVLDEARDRPVLLERDGEQYILESQNTSDPWAHYDPASVIEAVRQTTGSWSDVDTDALIEDIQRWREEGTRREAAR
jgi:hypothetical protein